MTRPAALEPGPLVGALRWALAGVLVFALHAGVVEFIIRRPTPSPLATGGPPLIAIDLDPVEGIDAKTPDDAPPPDAVGDPETATAPAAVASAGTPSPPAAAPPDIPLPPKPGPEPQRPTPQPPAPDPQSPLPPPDAVTPSSPASAAVAPPPPPVEAPSSTAAAGAEATEERAPAMRRTTSGAEAAWRGELVAHLNRFRRFLPGVAGGTARIGFTLDRQGRVGNLRIAASSGDAALDAAARAIVARASPFPAPPAETNGAALSFVVPVHFDGRRR